MPSLPPRLKAAFRLGPLAGLLLLGAALAQDAPAPERVTLDALFAQWDEATKDEEPGVSLVQPRRLRFAATYLAAPAKCNTQALQAILDAMGQADFLKKAPAEHCIRLKSDSGRELTAWTEDVLVPALNSEMKPGGTIEIQAEFLAYGVGSDRSRNMPLMLVSGFEAK